MLASSRRATVPSPRSGWVLAMSDACRLPARPQEPAGSRGSAVTLAELTVAEYDRAADASRDHGRVVAVDHAAESAVERHLLLVIAVHRVVESSGIDHHEVSAIALTQRAGVKPEPVGDLRGQAVHRVLDRHERI